MFVGVLLIASKAISSKAPNVKDWLLFELTNTLSCFQKKRQVVLYTCLASWCGFYWNPVPCWYLHIKVLRQTLTRCKTSPYCGIVLWSSQKIVLTLSMVSARLSCVSYGHRKYFSAYENVVNAAVFQAKVFFVQALCHEVSCIYRAARAYFFEKAELLHRCSFAYLAIFTF